MDIEYEAKFININKTLIREKLKKITAIMIKPEFLQKRVTFNLPNNESKSWIRIRDEKYNITMSLKRITGDKIFDQKEICLKVNDFECARKFLLAMGCMEKSYIENKRELWKLGDVEIAIDDWPFLKPFIEIEGKSERDVKRVSKKLGFDYSRAIFGSTDIIAQKEYNISLRKINAIPRIVFNMKNPFLNNI